MIKRYILIMCALLAFIETSTSLPLFHDPHHPEIGRNIFSAVYDSTSEKFHFFCAGVDANDNKIYDEGIDTPASWWELKSLNGLGFRLVREFDSFIVDDYIPVLSDYYFNRKDQLIICFASTGFSAGYAQKFNLSGSSSEKFYLTDGEFKAFQINRDYIVSAINTSIGEGIIEVVNDRTDDTTRVKTNSKIKKALLFDLENDEKDEIATFLENGHINFYYVREDKEAILYSSINLNQYQEFKGSLGKLYFDGSIIMTTFPSSHNLVEISAPVNGETEINIINSKEFGRSEIYMPLYNDYKLIAGNHFDFKVLENNSIVECKRSYTEIDFGFYSRGHVFLGKDSTLSVYRHSELERDPNYEGHIFTGYQPMSILEYKDKYLVLNLGVDFNADGLANLDSGDQYSSINSFKTDANGPFDYDETKVEINLPFYLNSPINTNISDDGRILLPSGNKAYTYDIDINALLGSYTSKYIIGTTLFVDDYLLIGTNDTINKKSYLVLFDSQGTSDTIEVAYNTVDLKYVSKGDEVKVISLSNESEESSSAANILTIRNGKFESNIEIPIGSRAYNIAVNQDGTKAAIMMSGWDKVHIIDLQIDELILTFSGRGNRNYGVRDGFFEGDILYLTNGGYTISAFNSNNGKPLAYFDIDGQTESIIVTDNYIYVTNNTYMDRAHYSLSTQRPNNKVVAFSKLKTTIDYNLIKETNIDIYPHPVGNEFHMVSDELVGELEIAIIDGQGKIVATHSAVADGEVAMSADELGLGAGNYSAIINGTKAVRFIVIK
ncbi:MAG: YncE family protein [Chlorobiota bacterium]